MAHTTQKPVANHASLSVSERLLAAAMIVIQTEGLQRMSQARVAQLAGLRQSHLTYYFPTRKDLLKALVETIHQQLQQSMQMVGMSLTPTQAAQHAAREFFVEKVREPTLARLMLALMNLAEEDPSLQQWIVDFDNALIAQLRDLFHKLGLNARDDDLALLHTNFVGIAILNLHDNNVAGTQRCERLTRAAFDHLVATTTGVR